MMYPLTIYRFATTADAVKLSVLFSQVYIQTYGIEGVSDEFADFIAHKFSTERLRNAITGNPDSMIVAVYNGNLVGVAEIDFTPQCPIDGIKAPELSKLYILEWFCGKGIGYELLGRAEEVIKQKGRTQAWLWVLETNVRAISFYERQQYRWVGNASFQMAVNKYENKVMLKQL